MKVISVINLKGGVAKSTTAINVSAILNREHGKRILLIDNDKQGNTSRFMNHFNAQVQCGSSRMLNREEPVIFKICDGFDLIAANMTLESAEYKVLESKDVQYNRYSEALKRYESDYDYVIIDNAPAVSMCVINALYASNEVIIPVKIDNWALDGVDVVAEQIEAMKKLNSTLTIRGILITNFVKSTVNLAAEEWLKNNCKHKVFITKIRNSKKVDESTFYKQPLIEFSKTSAACIDYKKFVKEYLELEKR